MKVIVAKKRGFCYGVKRAIDIVENALASESRRIYCIGSIIHNPQVVAALEEKGLEVIEDIGGLSNCEVILPSHGVDPRIVDKLKKKNLGVVDATCPYVLASHKILQNLKKDGYRIIIFGDKRHPEIKGLLGIADDAVVVDNIDELKSLNLKDLRVGVLAQTTRSRADFSKIVGYLASRDFKEVRVFNTICRDTEIRQDCVNELADEVDLMLIIGGKNSANTRHLADIARRKKVPAYHIESEKELEKGWLKNKLRIGVASGASTPEYIINNVIEKISNLD